MSVKLMALFYEFRAKLFKIFSSGHKIYSLWIFYYRVFLRTLFRGITVEVSNQTQAKEQHSKSDAKVQQMKFQRTTIKPYGA